MTGQLEHKADGKALVLMYHRIAEPATDPWSLSVAPHRFEEHLQVLRRMARPVKTRDLAHSLDCGFKERLAAVTFDDGYSDNYYRAKPLLERYDVPATMFLATGFLGSDREFWWDELNRLFLQPGTLPSTLHLQVSGGLRTWELGDVAVYRQAEFERHRAWRAEDPPPTPRQELYRTVWQTMQRMPAPEQEEVLRQILAWAKAAPEYLPENRPMRPEEAAALGTCELIETGAHTVTHPVLSTLPAGYQRKEIETSKKRVEAIVGRPVSSFTYPYGDCDAESVAILKENGFTNACSTAPTAIRNGADPLRLPRIQVANWSGEEFEERLSEWFGK